MLFKGIAVDRSQRHTRHYSKLGISRVPYSTPKEGLQNATIE